MAWSFAKLAAQVPCLRVADVGFDPKASLIEPYYIVIEQLNNFSSYPQEQQERWKCCGKTVL